MPIEIEHIEGRFSDESDAVLVTRGNSYNYVYRFQKHSKQVWELIEVTSEHYDVEGTEDPSESDLKSIMKQDPHVEVIHASDGRKLAELTFDVNETPYKNLTRS